MGRNDTTIKATIDIGAKIDQFQNGIKQIQDSLNKISVPNSVQQNFLNIFQSVEKEVQNIQKLTGSGEIKLVDVKSVSKSFSTIESLYNSLIKRLESEKVSTSFLKEDANVISKLQNEVKKYEDSLRAASNEWKKQKNELDRVVSVKREEKRIADAALTAAKNQGKLDQTNANARLKTLKDEKKELENQTKEVKTRFETEEEYRKRWLKTHDTQRGAPQAYRADAKNGKLESVEDPVATAKAQAEAQSKLAEKIKEVAEAEAELARAKNYQGTDKYQELVKNVQAAQEALEIARKDVDNFKLSEQNISAEAFKQIAESIQNMKGIDWEKYKVNPATLQSVNDLNRFIETIASSSSDKAKEVLQTINSTLIDTKSAGDEARDGFESAATGVKELGSTQSDIERLTTRLVQFFSIDNAVRLFKRAVRSAMSTIQDLDKVMTETAVVTEFTVADMWKQLPEYTKRANELGLAVRDVYEASTLYYQQGLKTNEVMAVTNATLRMARIAGLEAADATDRMTNALRGFNMEINETNADNVADVYSKLAAISASNVDEISTAMTKVASLANSANMSFENTAAFLSQIIETTRESAETAGTALKTVVARFSEVKELYSKGELLGTDEEGEEIDVNKVSKALRTAGINLNEFLTGQRGLDEIFMELASKWDDLDIVQQRYIATMAAGSRQQSRFIALMSDYRRTQELTTAAQNASGASMQQYEKTLESVETKVNRLKNAWNEFLMGIANDQFIRTALDMLTNLLQGINKLTDSISGGNGLLKSIANLGVAVGGLKIGKTLVKSILGDTKTGTQGLLSNLILGSKQSSETITRAGFETGKYYKTGFFKSIKADGGLTAAFKYSFKPRMSAGELGLKSVDFSDIDFNIKANKNLNSDVFGEMLMGIDPNQLGIEQQEKLASIQQSWIMASVEGKVNIQELSEELKEAGIQATITGEQADAMGVRFKNTTGTINTMSLAMSGIGAAMLGLTTIIEKLTGKQTPLTKSLKAVGIALLSLGSILPMVSKAFQTFGVEVSTSIMSIPIIGWIAAIISALIGLGVYLAEITETPAEAAENASQALESATEAANQAKEAVENLSDSYNNIVENANKLDNLTRGTKEWQKAVEENNKSILDLLQNYKELNIESQNGVLVITNYDQVMQDYATRERNLQTGELGANINKLQADRKLIASNASYKDFNILYYVNKSPSLLETLGSASSNDLSKDFGPQQVNLTQEQYETLARLVVAGTLQNAQDVNNYIQEEFMPENGFSLYGLTDENFQNFRAYGENLQNINYQLDTYYNAIGSQALAYSNLSDKQSEYADSLTTATVQIKDAYESFRGSLAESFEDNENAVKTNYLQWVAETFGKDVYVDTSGNFVDKSGKEWNYSDTSTLAAFSSWHTATNEFKEQIEDTTKYLEKLSNSTNESSKALAKSYKGNNGNKLTRSDLNTLIDEIEKSYTGFMQDFQIADLTQLNDIDSDLYKGLRAYWDNNENEELRAAFDNDFEAWVNTFATNIISARDTLKNAYSDFNNDDFERATENFSSQTVGAIANALERYTPSDSGKFGAAVINALKDMLPDESKLEAATNAFSAVQWNSIEDLESFKDVLKSMGIDVAESEFKEFLNTVQTGVEALTHIDFETFNEQIKDLANLINNIKSGKQGRTFSAEEYDLLTKNGVSKDLFVQSLTGEYSYIGNNLADIIQEANQGIVQQAKNELTYNQNRYDAATAITNSAYWGQYGTKEYQLRRATLQARQEGTLGTWGIEGLDNYTDFSALSQEEVDKLWEAVDIFKNSTTTYAENVDKYSQSAALLETMAKNPQEIVNDWMSGAIEGSVAQDALLSLMVSSNLPEQLKQQYIETFNDPNLQESVAQSVAQQMMNVVDLYANAEVDELDLEKVKDLADYLQNIKELSIESATSVGAANMKLIRGLNTIIGSYEEITNLITNGPLGKGQKLVFADSTQVEVFNKLKNNLKDTLDIAFDLSDAFFESSENIDNLNKLVNGSVEEQQAAFWELQKAAAIDLLINTGAADEEVNNFINYLSTIPIPDLEVGATIEDEQFIAALNYLMSISEEAGNAIAAALGVKQQFVQTGTQQIAYLDRDAELSGGDPVRYTTVPIYEEKWVSTGGGHADFSSLGGGGGRNAAGKSGSGSGSSSKEKLWKNPYDELYNLQEKVNDALREREKLEHRYQDMLKDHTKTSNDLVDNTYLEIAALKQQLTLNKQLLAGRQRQIAKVGNEMYEDSEGNRMTLTASGATKYAYYDANQGIVQIDYDAIDKITDENLGNAVEQYVSRLEEIRDQINDTEDTIEDINDQLFEIQDRGKQEYLDFEDKVYSAIVNARQAEIDALEKINESVNEATNKTLTAIQDEVAKERQARENEKAEQDILDKEMRLAYLQRDTSGANDLEMMKLQEEIANDQQSYQDQLIDQTIQEMQDEAARAEEQRQAQIDLLNYQLEFDEKHGQIWQNVYDLLNASIVEGQLDSASDLYQLLNGDKGVLSVFGQWQWEKDLAKEIAISIQGLQNYYMAQAREVGSMTLSNGTQLTYDQKQDKWFDAAGNEYNNLKYNVADNAFNASKIEQPKKTVSSEETQKALLQVSDEAPNQTPKNSDEPQVIGRITNVYGWVNVRSSVNTSSNGNIVAHTEKGQSFDVLGFGDYGWYMIKLPDGRIGYTAVHQNGTPLYNYTKFAQGGLADFTGPAWLDGTKQHPEMVLNAADTQNFIALKDILSAVLNSTQSSNKTATGGDNYFDIDIQAEIDSDYDVDKLADRIKKQIADDAMYRNVNVISQVR